MARRHARVVHDLAAAAAQFRQGSVRDERSATCATCAAGSGSGGHEPGPWLRLTALAGAAGTFVAVVSGSTGLGTGHRVLAALALPPLAAVAAAAWINYRRLLPDRGRPGPLRAGCGSHGPRAAPGSVGPGVRSHLVLVAQSWSHAEESSRHGFTKSLGGRFGTT